MKVAVVGLKKKNVERELKKFNLQLEKRNPEVIISYGGDGTILYSERMYPGIPKVFIRHSKTCEKCSVHNYSKTLGKLSEGRFEVFDQIKVEGIVNGDKKKRLIGMNEINICHKTPLKTIRLEVQVNGRIIQKEVIGDGVLVATPFGSTAYYYSITRKTFKKGLGIAFNNSRQQIRNIVVGENSIIKIKVLRDGGLMAADNNPRMISVKEGDVIEIKKAKNKAKIIRI